MPECPSCEATRDSWQKLRLHHLSAHDESLPNRQCETCDEESYNEYEKKYCSKTCRTKGRNRNMTGSANPNFQGRKETTRCEICGDDFEYYPSEKPGRFCPDCVGSEDWHEPPNLTGSENPRYNGGKVNLQCDVCDRRFERYPSNVNEGATLCSPECQADWLSEAFTGEGHPNWEGGGNENYGPGWAPARERALERDGHECVVCGATREELGRNPDVHHVVPVRRFVEHEVLTKRDAHTLDNLVSLCPSCHRKAEFGKLPQEALRRRVAPRP